MSRLILYLLLAASIVAGQESGPDESKTMEQAPIPSALRAYRLVRSDEDWSFLRNAPTSDLFDPVKFIPFGNSGWLTLGGEVREFYERIENDNWLGLPRPSGVNGYLLQRYHLLADVHWNRRIRTFVQVKSDWVNGREGGPRPIDQDKLDFLQGFVDLDAGSERRGWTLRAGRQEFFFGSGRLVSPREGPNVRQSFDGARLMTRWDLWRVDLFAARPSSDSAGVFDNRPLHGTSFWGVYATKPWRRHSRNSIDLYYLGLDRKKGVYNEGSAREQRHSVGVRFAQASVPEAKNSWDYDVEAVYQFGTFGDADIRAWTAASETGFTFGRARVRPRASLRADISSGDKDPHNPNLQTFSALFPVGNYFGVLATTGPGPVNFEDLHPRIEAQLPHGVSIFGDWLFQWRQSLHDGIYAVPGFLIVPAGTSSARFVGHRPGMEARWQVNRHAFLQVDYGVFLAGTFLRESGRPNHLGYLAIMAGYKF